MTKYVARNAKVEAHEVSAANLARLASEFGGAVHHSVREPGVAFLLFEGKNGSTRADIGGFVVVAPDGDVVGFRTAEAFHLAYERP